MLLPITMLFFCYNYFFLKPILLFCCYVFSVLNVELAVLLNGHTSCSVVFHHHIMPISAAAGYYFFFLLTLILYTSPCCVPNPNSRQMAAISAMVSRLPKTMEQLILRKDSFQNMDQRTSSSSTKNRGLGTILCADVLSHLSPCE